MISKKHKKVCTTLNYIEHFIYHFYCEYIHNNECISISAFASLLDIAIGITSFAIGLKIYKIVAGIKTYKSIIKNKKNKHDEIIYLATSELNKTEFLIFKALIDSAISHDEFVLINNVPKEYNKVKEEIRSLKT